MGTVYIEELQRQLYLCRRVTAEFLLNEEQQLVGKYCGNCGLLYTLNDFYKDKYDLYGKTATCKHCRTVSWENFKAENPDYYRQYWLTERDKLKSQVEHWRSKNPERVMRQSAKSVYRRQQALSNCNKPDPEYVNSIKQHKVCDVTGDTVQVEMDHILPVTKGRWGSNKGNLMQLSRPLNISKGNKNVFEWVDSMEQERLDYLVKGKMTVEQFQSKMYQALTVKAAEMGLTLEQYKQEYNEEYNKGEMKDD